MYQYLLLGIHCLWFFLITQKYINKKILKRHYRYINFILNFHYFILSFYYNILYVTIKIIRITIITIISNRYEL